MPNDNRIYLDDKPVVPLPESEQTPNDSTKLQAAFLATVFVVRGYQSAGFTAHNTRNRLQQRFDDCRKGGLWDAKHYNYCAWLYREAIQNVYGVRVKFRKASA